jgi:hypothetical protein
MGRLRRGQVRLFALLIPLTSVLVAGIGLAAEVNATLWERRAQRLRPNAPPP